MVYAGATQGVTDEGKGPTTAWLGLGFIEATRVGVTEGIYDQNVIVLRVP